MMKSYENTKENGNNIHLKLIYYLKEQVSNMIINI